jgi:FKBP-type peptidyl-prolyl cis-trans isomerase
MFNNMQMRKSTGFFSFAMLAIMLVFNSCDKEYATIQDIDEARIQAYIKQNNLSMTKDPTGFYYQVLTQGTGAPLRNRDSVFYTLNVKSLAGVSFFKSEAYGNEGNYLGYINPSSYRIALLGVRRGSKVSVILPSYLAYGKNGNAQVPPNEVIVTEINVLPQPTLWQLDDQKITNFLTANNLTAVKSPSRVHYILSQAGSGPVIDIGSTVTLKYKGRLFNGTVFDETVGTGYLVTKLNELIKGWEVLLGMQKGAKLRIFIPSDLAYGLNPPSGIPVSACLDFDIEVIDVTN